MSESTKTIQFDASLLQGGTRRRNKNQANKTRKEKPDPTPIQLNRNILKMMRQQQVAEHKQYLMKGVSGGSSASSGESLQQSLDYFRQQGGSEEIQPPPVGIPQTGAQVGFGSMSQTGGQTNAYANAQVGGRANAFADAQVSRPSVIFPTGMEIPGVAPAPLFKSKELPNPEYSNLKGSVKPTFRQLARMPVVIPTADPLIQGGNSEAKRKDVSYQRQLLDAMESASSAPGDKDDVHKRHVRTYRLGRSKQGLVSVLLSNKQIRRTISKKKHDLKRLPMQKVRQDLVRKGFIRMGSTAPDNVLREIYENVEMIGQVRNFSPDILMHNLLGEEAK
jgi:hypothetical protein